MGTATTLHLALNLGDNYDAGGAGDGGDDGVDDDDDLAGSPSCSQQPLYILMIMTMMTIKMNNTGIFVYFACGFPPPYQLSILTTESI